MGEVRRLSAAGWPATEVARATGVPYGTVLRWRRGATEAFGPAPAPDRWRPPDAWTYAYLLGLYLGDGNLVVSAGRSFLRLSLDGIHPELIDEARDAVVITTLGRTVRVYDDPLSRGKMVQASWKRWPEAFPQHGPGRKHERAIVLEGWQREIVEREPAPFVRGLIHSDGCRTVNRFTTTLPSGRVAQYEYPRYFFSNLSPEIRRLFREACDRLGVKTTMSNPRNVSISQRASVRILEEIVGPKA